jgi:ABC-type multidrug transport system ATPase subunit
MPREEIRSRLICVTQAPYLFAGTGRENLDPFGRCETMEIIQVLEAVQMWDLFEELGGLDVPLNADVMSLGQRQLLCLARAMLRRGSILILDEATASIDHDTDDLVQKIIRTHFSKHTVIAIAHRLNTIVDFDRVAVINAGELVEFDTPDNLLAREHSFFKDLYTVSAAGAQSRKNKATKKDGQLYEHSNINIGADGAVYDLSHATSSSVNMPMFPINSPITPVTPGGSWRQYDAEHERAVMAPEMVPKKPGTDSKWEDDSNENQPLGQKGRDHDYSRIKHSRDNSEDEEMQLWLKTQTDNSFLVSKSQRKGRQKARPQSQVSNSGVPARMASAVSESFGRLKRDLSKNYYNPFAG